MTRLPLLVTLVLLSLLPAALWAAPTFDDWVKHRNALTKDPDVVRYYVFDKASDAQTPVPSLVGEANALQYAVQPGPGDPETNPVQIGGRFTERLAVQLNRGIYTAPAFPVEDKRFTVEAWVRTHGQGNIKGDRPEQSGTLLSAGNGYWDGWRITLSYPSSSLGFEMGKRPGSFGIRAGTGAPDEVWHHLVATWDGAQTRLYVDGMLVASGEYNGDYVPATTGFRLGFANAGWGSILADYDEVLVYKRALTAREVAQHTLFYAPLAADAGAKLAAADEAFAKGENAAARDGYAALLKTALHPHWAAAIRLRLGQVLLRSGDARGALQAYTAVIETPDLPDWLGAMALSPVMQLALSAGDVPPAVYTLLQKRLGTFSPRQQLQFKLNLARALARSGKAAEAAKLYAEVLKMPELTPRDRLEVMLQSGHSLTAGKQYAAARAQYAKLLTDPEASAAFRSYALLCQARTYLKEKQWGPARAAYEQVQKLADVPEVHQWEAGEWARETARLAKGLPARDPAASRTPIPALPTPGAQYFVAPTGADNSPGSKEKPFATLARAQAAVRELIAKGLPKGGVTVNLAAGTYQLAEGMKFGPEDSGTAASPVVWRATEPGKAILTGGHAVPGLKPVTDSAILDRLPTEARGKVLQADLKAQGITAFGELKPRGFSHGGGTPALELFANGQPLPPARWPNEGFARVKRVVGNDDQGAVFEYDDARPERWGKAKDPWVFGYWKWQWADSRDPVTALVTAQKTMRIPKVTYGGIEPGAPYFVYNLLEEIDQPGEWYVDRESGVLYLYPTADPAQTDLRVSLVGTPLVALDQAAFVRLQGLTLEYGQWHGVEITGGEGCLVAGCVIRNLSGDGVIIGGGRNHGVFGCELYNLGRGGTRVAGGDRKTLTPGGHFVENCDIHHFSRVDRTYTPAVLLDGCGNRLAHNRFHHTPCHAMRIEGNDHIIEFNDVYEVVRESDDQGGVDMWANPAYRGVVFRYNYFHDIGTPYPTPCGQAGIRLDDAISGILIYGNIFQRCSASQFGAIQLHGGKDDVIVNNIFADCKFGISFSGWGPARWKEFLDSQWVQDKLHKEVEIAQPPYSTKYPGLARLYEGEGIHQIWRNVAVNCGEFLTRDRGIQDLMDNAVSLEDPGFVDRAAGNFSLKPDASLLGNPGFRPIPCAEIGQYDHPLRIKAAGK